MALYKLLQINAFDEFHHHEILAADLPEVISLDNVGMDQVGNESCLTDEVALELCDCRIFLPNNFYRDDLPEIAGSKLHGLVDDAHAALRDLAGHLVVEFVEDVLKFCHGNGGRGA